jgi:GTPase SAR1 family protein
MFYLCVQVARVDIASIRMIFWDLGGQEDLQNLWDKVSGCTSTLAEL